MCTLCIRITVRERWGAFSNVSSKCQLKITGVLEKVGSEGTDIFSFLTQQCLSDRAAGWHDGIYFVSSLIHSDKALQWIPMKDTRGQIYEAQTNCNCPISLLVFWYSDLQWTSCHVCQRGKKRLRLMPLSSLQTEKGHRLTSRVKYFWRHLIFVSGWLWC